MKNIVIITGSARRGGNSELMAKTFMEGARQAGHNVSLIEAFNKKISCCIGCDTCFSKGRPCSTDDDFNKLAPIIESADTIVFCTPLYWCTFSASIKMIIDKLHSFGIGKREMKIKEAVLMVSAGADNIEVFDGIIKTFESIINFKKWRNAGIITVLNAREIGDIKKTDELKKIKELGVNI